MGVVFFDLISGTADALVDELLSGLPSAEHNAAIGRRGLLLLAWLDHVANNLDKSTTYASNYVWVARNVEVLTSGFALWGGR